MPKKELKDYDKLQTVSFLARRDWWAEQKAKAEAEGVNYTAYMVNALNEHAEMKKKESEMKDLKELNDKIDSLQTSVNKLNENFELIIKLFTPSKA